MIKKNILRLWSLRHEFTKYSIIGVSAFIFDMGSLYLLKKSGGLSPVTAVVLNQPFILLYVFFLNRRWSFRAIGLTHKQMIKFMSLAGMNYLFSVAWMWFFNQQLGLHYLAVRISNIVLAVAWNFLLYKYWVYGNHDSRLR